MMGARSADQLGWHYCDAQARWVWLEALQEVGGEEKALTTGCLANDWVLPRVLGQDAKCLVCQWAYVSDWFRAHSVRERVNMMSWHMRARIIKIRASIQIEVPDLELEKIPESGPRRIESARKSMNTEGSEMDEMKKDPVLW